jgi:DMSO reductase anchor subunit
VHPAFSVIFFTTASGAGFGLLAWLGTLALAGALPPRLAALVVLGTGMALAAAGLLSSLAHLGQPQRAWMAFSQWRSSWLSREGVFATATFAPALWLGWLLWSAAPASAAGLEPVFAGVVSTVGIRVTGALLVVLAVASVVCTAMIYASLKPIPAWRHPLVLPIYLLFSLFTGGLLFGALSAAFGGRVHNIAALAAIAGGVLLWRLKRHVWMRIDTRPLPVTRNAALGLPEGRDIKVFERPHTEANYLLREMGYVLARKHARRLRAIAVLLFALLPAIACLPVWLLPHADANPWFALAAASALLGGLIERWLFFAEARHLVTLYY